MECEIYKLELLCEEPKSVEWLKSQISERIGRVQGEFRQAAILHEWENFYHNIVDLPSSGGLPMLTLKAEVSSGTYIRSLCERLGLAIGCPTVAFEIKRVSVGDFSLSEAISVFPDDPL